jgi:hypothetical protein
MIVKATAQTLPRKGICVAVATSRSAFAAAAVYSRIISTVERGRGTAGLDISSLFEGHIYPDSGQDTPNAMLRVRLFGPAITWEASPRANLSE